MTQAIRDILLATFFFSLMNAGVKLLDRLPSHEIVFFRALVLCGVSLALVRRAGLSPWGNNRRLLIARGAAGTVALVLYFYTVQVMPLGSAVTIQYLSPVFAILLGGVLLGEKARAAQWPFFVLALAGAVLVKGFDARVTFGELAIGIAAALASGLAYTLIRKLRATDHPLVVVFYFSLVTLPVVGPYTALHWTTPSGVEWLVLLAIGLCATTMQVFMTRAYQQDRAANVSVFNYLGSAYALIIGYLFFSEAVPALAYAGIGLIVIGVVLATRLGHSPHEATRPPA